MNLQVFDAGHKDCLISNLGFLNGLSAISSVAMLVATAARKVLNLASTISVFNL